MRLIRNLVKKMSSNGKPLIPNTLENRPFTVVVEGNMGCGKTTFLERFKGKSNICVLSEPVENWRNVNGHNLLHLMYENPETWSFTFQSYVQLTMLQNHLLPTTCAVKIMERSIYSARYCFVEKLTRDGVLPLPSAAVMDSWFKWILQQNFVQVDLLIYLRSSPEVAYERILKRKRPEENMVSLDYVKYLHEIHENWLYFKTLFTCPAPILVLNADQSTLDVHAEYEKWKPDFFRKTLNN
ncbi:hypothetical protein ABEB36_000351 [Hypothenemus hampei]|uniref:Deoxynucleoside kinase domain-containing protein n=1 Tax=Hypothenemus hampei TaxID=57062 RepID=A0ABD1FAZ3_HYPHA